MSWQPIETAPLEVPIKIGYRTKSPPGWWEGTGICHEAVDADGDVERWVTVVHYNMEPLVPVFYATHWQPLPKPPSDTEER